MAKRKRAKIKVAKPPKPATVTDPRDPRWLARLARFSDATPPLSTLKEERAVAAQKRRAAKTARNAQRAKARVKGALVAATAERAIAGGEREARVAFALMQTPARNFSINTDNLQVVKIKKKEESEEKQKK